MSSYSEDYDMDARLVGGNTAPRIYDRKLRRCRRKSGDRHAIDANGLPHSYADDAGRYRPNVVCVGQ